ncbi:MAG TPA: helix-turn-helix domain-containing protein [Chryseolinea sp.]|nr:helix-turn-helix domain-containing protein [Chryseolinea sp.]
MNLLNTAAEAIPYASSSFLAQLYSVAQGEDPILLVGGPENGKEYCAQAIHDNSGRQSKPFLVANCRLDRNGLNIGISYPVNQDITSVLRVQAALPQWLKGGTIYMNGFHLLPLADKQRVNEFVRLLELRLIVNLPARQLDADPLPFIEMPVDARLLTVPKLSDRSEDISFFSNYFLTKVATEWSRNLPGFTEEAFDALRKFSWTGNLQQLRDVIRQAAFISSESELITFEDLPLVIKNHKAAYPCLLKDAIKKAEYELICDTLSKTKNNKRKAAAILNISRKTLYSKLNFQRK